MSEEVRKNIIDVIRSSEIVQFCTFRETDYPETRTVANMLNRNIKNLDFLYFITNKKSHKLIQIKKNKNVCLYYFNPENRHAMTLFGEAEQILNDTEKKSFWNDNFKKFGYTGKDDENYRVIKFKPKIYKFYTGNLEEHTGNL